MKRAAIVVVSLLLVFGACVVAKGPDTAPVLTDSQKVQLLQLQNKISQLEIQMERLRQQYQGLATQEQGLLTQFSDAQKEVTKNVDSKKWVLNLDKLEFESVPQPAKK